MCLETSLAESMHLLQSPAMHCNLLASMADPVCGQGFPPPWSDEARVELSELGPEAGQPIFGAGLLDRL